MKHFLLPPTAPGERLITLKGADCRYLTRVLRKRVGDDLPAVDVRGARHRMRIMEIRGGICVVELAPMAAPGEPGPPAQAAASSAGPGLRSAAALCLFQCLPKGRKMDLIVRQAVEAGVDCIAPLVSERSVAVPARPEDRRERWLRIAREAAQQCGAVRPPEILEPRDLGEAAAGAAGQGTALFFHQERVDGGSLHEALAAGPERVSILVGPEGGLSDREVALLRDAGFIPVYLGESVLRTETAALYALAAVRTVLQEREWWTLSRQR
jgi:16S rRNA (uracil1498-N3)-methyltransferase